MRGTESDSCATLSASLGEPLTGTASRYRHWLLIEQPGRWGHDALVESAFPPTVGAALRSRAEALHLRILLIKQRERPPGTGRRCFVAYTGIREHRLASFEAPTPRDLLILDLESLVERRFEGFGEEVEGPLFLVCTHGKHDPCCARLGLPLYGALAGFGDGAVWEATHVGGDRFAGNLVCFPHGLYFGRVGPEDAARVAGSYAAGRIELDRYRGRSAHSPAVQAAEHLLRRRTGLLGVDDLVPLRHEVLGEGRHVVVFVDAEGDEHPVEVEIDRDDSRLLTCKAAREYRPRRFFEGEGT